MRRLLWWGVALAVAAPFVTLSTYAAVVPWLLTGPRLRAWINVRPQELLLDYDAATWQWPNRVTLHNVHIRGSDPNVQWLVRLEDVDVEYSVLALLTKTLRCRSVRGFGLSFFLRTKLDPKAAKSTDTSVLPSIPGFADPPLRSREDHFIVDPHAWSIDMREVSIDRFEQIWVNGFQYRGNARVQGGFFLRPLMLAEIRAAAISLEGGEARLRPAPAGFSVSGTLTAFSEPFQPLREPIPRVLNRFSADLKLEARFDNPKAFDRLVGSPGGARVEGGQGTATITATVRKGIADGGVRLTIRKGAVVTREYRLRGDVNVEVSIRRSNLVSGPFDISGSTLALTNVHSSGPDESRGWWGRFAIPSGRIGSTVYAKVGIQCRDARPLLALLGVKLPGWTSGLLKLDDLSGAAAVATSPAGLRVEDLEAKGGGFQIQGRFAQDGAAANGAFLIQSGILIVGIEVAPKSTKVRPFFAKQWYDKLQTERATGGR